MSLTQIRAEKSRVYTIRYILIQTMADWSPEHNTYLSCLLDDVTGTEEMVKIRQDFCKISDCIMSVNPESTNRHYTGSKAEGLDLAGSDEDYMIDVNELLKIEVSESLQDLVWSMRTNRLLIVTDDVPPAFAMLKCVTLQDDSLLLRSAVNMGEDVYLSSQQFVSTSPLCATTPGPRRIQGPSIEIWTEYGDTSESGQDNVPSIRCKSWPTSAAEWKVRPRNYGWPSQHVKEYIEQYGCHLVPIGHPLSGRKSLEWRLSFSIAERILVWSFNHNQLQCYAVMKLVLKECVKTKCVEKHKSVLCSYFIKTFLFWQFEKMEPLFWRIENLSGCIMYLLHEFYRCIQIGVLRHYFLPRFNLLEIKLTPDAQTELLKIFGKITEAGISILGQSNSLAGVYSNFIARRYRRHCEMRTTEIQKHRILDNDGNTMTYVDRIMSNINVIEKRYESPRNAFLFAVLVRLSSERDSKYLTMFAIRHLCCLIVIRKLFSASNQCNKNLHYYMKSLSKNVYGTDLILSKLWLATFLLLQGDYYRSLQNVNNVLSSIPPYALYNSGRHIMSGEDSKRLYVDRYYGRNTDILCRAKEAWLFDMHIRNREYSFVPRAIQIELDHCDPVLGIGISPFTYAYYLMFLCYHRLGQYDDRDRALRQLVDTANDRERCSTFIYHVYNVAGHCMLIAGYVDMARNVFLESARFTQPGVFDKYNAAYKYLSLM